MPDGAYSTAAEDPTRIASSITASHRRQSVQIMLILPPVSAAASNGFAAGWGRCRTWMPSAAGRRSTAQLAESPEHVTHPLVLIESPATGVVLLVQVHTHRCMQQDLSVS